MTYVDQRVEELKNSGIYSAQQVDSNIISKIVNMNEWEYYDIEITILESYLGILSQQIMYLQQEQNKAEAKEIEIGNSFKISALPEVIGSKIRSVEERWLYASTLTPELKSKFELWQNTLIEATLRKKLAEPLTEKLYVLKKIYDDRRQDGNNKNLHKYSNGSS